MIAVRLAQQQPRASPDGTARYWANESRKASWRYRAKRHNGHVRVSQSGGSVRTRVQGTK
jgi:hypothetical protein